jgi:hypothetical protein
MISKTEAAYKILKEEKKPLHSSEIIKLAIKKGLIETKGKTPESTLNVDIYLENKRRLARKDTCRFKKVGPAIFALTEWGK